MYHELLVGYFSYVASRGYVTGDVMLNSSVVAPGVVSWCDVLCNYHIPASGTENS